MEKLTAPQLLSEMHVIDGFDCGIASLNEWLVKNALKNQYSNASRTFVVCDQEQTVLGYYCLAAGSLTHEEAIGAIRRNMPSPIPIIVLGRLAVDFRAQGKELGKSLLRDAVLRSQNISQQLGARALLVHAISEEAKRFYLKYGFKSSELSPYTLMRKL
ncbi:GNAT family N-acetyltransferase [Neisseria canis]|uniref:Acetyltransferase n=1 Tax=Neisseria canis TaxID=493 RepID=A0A1X3D022_9NEIS|nr:GNAT family N-acetyltransferase [Neisseria canis]OSI13044.1 GNAT family N-acetyltransferase [Neisseria canis]VEF02379.1 acetyltransferase [Neisseria canis]